MARENCTLYRDKFITDCNENCYGCCNRLYDKYIKLKGSRKAQSDRIKEFREVEALVNQGYLPTLKENK
mgnify:CR=1 FL=1